MEYQGRYDDQGTQFTSKLVKDITGKYKIKHRKSTPYHPQANGQVESTNKTLEGIITKTVEMNRKNWDEKLKDELWAYKITWKKHYRIYTISVGVWKRGTASY